MAVAVESSLPALLDVLASSITSATTSIPEASSFKPPADGISLLDVKNELLLSYLQNLVFLIILKLRNHKASTEDEDEDLDSAVVKKLVELRVYLEKGVRPLENRLKYQIDKVLRASDDAARAAGVKNGVTSKKTGDKEEENSEESDGSDEEPDSVDGDGGVPIQASEIDDLQYRPNPSALLRPTDSQAETANDGQDANDGIYKPPRITATSMPTTTPHERKSRQPNKSATIDEFIADELSVAPIAEPSIGSNVIAGGRRSKSEKEKRQDEERREYEERNYVRLPKLSKKDRAKQGKTIRDAGYGGEEWRGLGEGVERIERLTARKGDSSTRSVLEKSRKRAVEDGPRDSGSGEVVGERFQKRVKTLDGKRGFRGGAGRKKT